MTRGFIITLLLLITSFTAFADKYVGKVLDEAGNPLIGATIADSNGKPLGATDSEGNFSFTTESGGIKKLKITYVGYKTGICNISPDTVSEIRLEADRTFLDEVVVTATRTPKSLKDVPVVTRVITGEDIKRNDATNVQDLLTEELPGLEFGYSMSQETSLTMNGFGGNAVLFLVDGERLAGETLDNVDYNRLNLENVGRIEIVKGASSALYGANAVGGVVNLISSETTEPWSVSLNSRYRSFGNEWRNSGDINFNIGQWSSNTSLQYTTSETVALTSAFDTDSKIHNVYGGSSLNIKERVVFRVNDRLKFIARGGYFDRTSNRGNYDDRYNDYSGGLRSVWDINENQSIELSYSYDQYDKRRYVGKQHTNDHDYSNRQHIVHAMYNRNWGLNGLTVGADYMHDQLSTYQFVDATAKTQTSVDLFAQFDYNPLSWLNIVAGIRDDWFSASSNNALTARLATMFKLKPLSIRASYAGGFRAPTLKEMYMSFDMAGIQMIYGNENLKPERSHNFNVALERNGRIGGNTLGGSYSLTLSGYFNYYNSRITTTDYAGDPENGDEAGAIYCNEEGVKVAGIDANARYKSHLGVGVSVSYNYLHMSGNVIDSQFSQPRPHSATWRIDYDNRFNKYYRLYAALSGRFLSKPKSSYDTDNAYALWKLTVQQEIWKGVNLNFVVDNLFNYKPQTYYWNSAPTTGTTWSIGLSLNIDEIFKSNI